MTPHSKRLILASGSPRRIDLLRELGLEFDVVPASIEETLQPDVTPEENANDLARQKAKWVAERHPHAFVLGADTIVVLEGAIIGKPRDEEDALDILSRLGGKSHQVITGMALVDPNGAHQVKAVISTVHIKSMDEETLRRYIATGEPMDKAGAYAIQGEGAFLVDRWSGSWSNIVGLPTEAIVPFLKMSRFPVEI